MSKNEKEPKKNALKKEKQKKKKRNIGELFNNDKFMLALSFVSAFLIWTIMSMNNGETVNYPVSDIPVTMELSEDAKNDELSVVTVDGVPIDDFFATVRVKGNSVTVGSLKPSDIQVYGINLGNIVTSGSYTVTLMARQLGVKNNYDIVSVSPSEVKVLVDRNIKSEFTIESQINATSPVEYYIGTPSLSQQNVTVTGPEQSVSKAVKAVVSTDVEKELEQTTTLSGLKVELLDAEGKVIQDDSVTVDPVSVDATIPVLVKKKVPLTLDFINEPPGLDTGKLMKLEPSEIEIAAAADTIDSVSAISAGTVDFSTISYGMTSMSCSVVMPEGVRNLNNIENAFITFDFSEFSTKSVVLTKIDYLNVPPGLAAEHSSYGSLMARIIGPRAEIAEITTEDLTASVDLSGSKIGTSVMPVDIRINSDTSCWIFGTYSINVTVKDENDISDTPSSDKAASSAASSGS